MFGFLICPVWRKVIIVPASQDCVRKHNVYWTIPVLSKCPDWIVCWPVLGKECSAVTRTHTTSGPLWMSLGSYLTALNSISHLWNGYNILISQDYYEDKVSWHMRGDWYTFVITVIIIIFSTTTIKINLAVTDLNIHCIISCLCLWTYILNCIVEFSHAKSWLPNCKILIDSNHYTTSWLIFFVNHLINDICINWKDSTINRNSLMRV